MSSDRNPSPDPNRTEVESLAAQLEGLIQRNEAEAVRLRELYEESMRRVEDSKALLERVRRQLLEEN